MELFLLSIVIVALIVAYLLTPTPNIPGMAPAGLEEFTIPDNSNSRTVPKVYGTAYLAGNCIYYGNLTYKKIRK